MKFSKDRRGYETTTVVQPRRSGGRGPSRVLYFFRTPPAVRVGRSALDEETIRLLEAHHPDVQFDWHRMLKQGPVADAAPAASPAPPPEPRGRERRKERRPSATPRPDPVPALEPSPEPLVSVDEHTDAPVSEAPSDDAGPDLSFSDLPDASYSRPDDDTRVVYQLLGAEGLGRLRARYAELMARIAEKPLEDTVREELKERAERLNPDGWVTEGDVRAGLEQYESIYEGLRAVVGQRRRRRRRR